MLLPTDRKEANPFELRSLREQVYQYLRAEMQKGHIVPGEYIRLNEMSDQLGISKTPLRDAVIQLECEGFVTILPRRGVLMNRLTLQDVKDAYDIVGALEAAVVVDVSNRFEADRLDAMTEINNRMKALIEREDFDHHYADFFSFNVAFHDHFLDLSDNRQIKKIVIPIKQRLYDFPRRGYIKEWEKRHLAEHEKLIKAIANGDRDRAADVFQNEHWCFKAHKNFLDRFYELEEIKDNEI